jgi:hypothetical protein
MLCVGTEDCEDGIVYIASYIWLNTVVAYYSKWHVAGTLSLKCWYPLPKSIVSHSEREKTSWFTHTSGTCNFCIQPSVS